jgi:hypothetical protein
MTRELREERGQSPRARMFYQLLADNICQQLHQTGAVETTCSGSILLKGALMSKQPIRRYQIWTLAKDEPYERRSTPRSFLVSDEDDATSLYHYGLPIEIQLPGLCILPNGRSTACKTKKISSETVSFIYDLGATGGARFRLPDDLRTGTVMHIDLERIGEFHGALSSQDNGGFQIAVDGEYKDILSKRLAVLATTLRNIGLDDGTGTTKPSFARIEPDNKNCRFADAAGAIRKGWLINISPVDALVKAAIVPPVGATVTFGGPGRYVAEVTRVFEIGFAVKFLPPIPDAEFSPAIKLTDE